MSLRTMIPKKTSPAAFITVASAEEKRAAIAVRRFGRIYGSSRVDDQHASDTVDRASNALVAMYSSMKERRLYYFQCFDAASRGDVVTQLAEGPGSFQYNDVLNPHTDVPIPLVRVTTALPLGVIVYLTNLGSMAEQLRHIGESTDLHMKMLEACITNEVERLERSTESCPALANDIDLVMRGDVLGTTIGLGPFAFPWMRECRERTRELEDVLAYLRRFRESDYGEGDATKSSSNKYAPWTMLHAIATGHIGKGLIVLHLMNQLFQAWCPHNYSANQWMLIKHKPDILGFETPAMQCRVAFLVLLVRYQRDFHLRFTARDHGLIIKIGEHINRMLKHMSGHMHSLDHMRSFFLDELFRRWGETRPTKFPATPEEISDSSDTEATANPETDPIEESDEEPAPAMSPVYLLEEDDEEFSTAELLVETPGERPSILCTSPLLFPHCERIPEPMSAGARSTDFILSGEDDDAFETYLTIQ